MIFRFFFLIKFFQRFPCRLLAPLNTQEACPGVWLCLARPASRQEACVGLSSRGPQVPLHWRGFEFTQQHPRAINVILFYFFKSNKF